MDYVKQMEILRQRNIELSKENEELKKKLEEIDTLTVNQSKASKESFENTKQSLIDALEKYKNINTELENYKIEYQLKLKELSETLHSIRDVVELHEDENDEILKQKIMETPN